MSRAYGVPSRRKKVIELLTEAYARDELEQSEFEKRVERAEHARTIDELDELIADFPEEVVNGSVPAVGPGGVQAYGAQVPGPQLSGAELQKEVDRLDGMAAPTRFNLLGDQHVAVSPADPAVVRSVSLLGDCEIDLRSLSGRPGAFLVKVAALLGDTTIIVPRGTPVDFRLISLLGDEKRVTGGKGLKKLAKRLGLGPREEDAQPPAPGPTVVVMGFKLLGDTQVIEV
jgi:hypothetical protein